MVETSIIRVAKDFHIHVKYEGTNRNGTKSFKVEVKADGDKDFIPVGKFFVSKHDEVKYHVKCNDMFCSFLNKEIKSIYTLSELKKLIPTK